MMDKTEIIHDRINALEDEIQMLNEKIEYMERILCDKMDMPVPKKRFKGSLYMRWDE